MKTNLESKISALSIEYQQVLKKHPALYQLLEELKELLLEIKEQVDRAKDGGRYALEPELVSVYHHRYQTILTPALQIYSREDERDKPTGGRKKQSKAKNLLDRPSCPFAAPDDNENRIQYNKS